MKKADLQVGNAVAINIINLTLIYLITGRFTDPCLHGR